MATTPDDLKRTPLTGWHRAHGARMVPFAGYEMPVQYEGVLAEHRRVREHVGLFDITHMAEIEVVGPGAEVWLDRLTTNRVAGIPPGKVVYTAMCRPDGGVLDDMLIYRLAPENWLVVCNAANHAKINDWLHGHAARARDVALADVSDRTAMIAVQGPDSPALLDRLPHLAEHRERIRALDFYTACCVAGPGGDWVVSRTGYTGERGYEIYLPWDDALPVWEALLAAGEDLQAGPIGLGARDTLRFEVGYCLYGHELSEEWTPLEAGIGWAVRFKDRDFVGRDALLAQKRNGPPRRLVGLEVPPPADHPDRPAPIARHGAEVVRGGAAVGHVTSGTRSPSLGRSLALALVASDAAGADDLAVLIRGREVPVRRVPYPFLPPRVKGDPHAPRDLTPARGE